MNLRILAVHPGASWSTSDVFDGAVYGLRQHGVEPILYRLDERIAVASKTLHTRWRQQKKNRPDLPKPTQADVIYQAGVGALEMALRHQVHVVFVVSAMFLHPDVIVMMKRAGLRVVVLFTESPYDLECELKIAALVDGCWTNERTSVQAFQAVNPNSGYLPHAWHPERHAIQAEVDSSVPAHDVVFVGSGFTERIEWFNAIDWTGIDLGLYGTWKGLGLKPQVKACIKGEQVSNVMAAALYRHAKVGLNLYRQYGQRQTDGRRGARVYGESLSPRAYELAAVGAFSISDYRLEVSEVFGDLVPTFSTPTEAAALIRFYLGDDAERARMRAALPACVAEATWAHRAATLLGDLQRLYAEATTAA